MKPMLAGKLELAKLQFPAFASPKLDGIRAIVVDGVLVSRKLIAIPNRALQTLFGHPEFNGLDGELIVGSPTSPTAFRDTTSVVMSHDKPVDGVVFHVFDNYLVDGGWQRRFAAVEAAVQAAHGAGVPADPKRVPLLVVPHVKVLSQAELMDLDAKLVGRGFEGTMVRSPGGPYKHGRSTTNEGYLLKFKQFEDAEAEVIGFEELMHNGNEALKDNLGRTKRSSHQANKTGLGRLGALILRRPDGVEFNCGTGFDDAERIRIWGVRDTMLGKQVKYRFFPSGGKDKPRFPTYLGFRDPKDL